MKRHNIIWPLFLLIGFIWATPLQAASNSVQATLILGSDQGSTVHPSLKAYERNLKSIFKYTSYDLRGRGNTSINLPGKSTLNMGGGHTLLLNAAPSNNGKIKLQVNWTHANRSLINTTLVVRPGQPTVLGGPNAKDGDGKLIIVIVAR